MRLIANSQDTLSCIIGVLREEFKTHRYLTVSISPKKGRTSAQNSLSHAWYSQVSKELKEHTEGEIKCLCKYHFGIPILRGEDEEFNDACIACIDPLVYENKIKAMEYMPVTSRMNTEQLGRYLDAVHKNYIGRVDLTFPE